MGSVVFTDTYSQTGYNAQTQNVRINYSESYIASTNTTTISLDSIDFSTTLNVPNCPVRGAVDFNSTNVIDMPSSTVAYNVSGGNGSYGRVSQSYGVRTLSVIHNPDGTASFTVYLKTASSSGYNTFGIQYSEKYWGVRTPVYKTISLTKHTSTLTVKPNGGTWNGKTINQTFSQAPTSTRTIVNPTRTGYTFSGWSLSGGGLLSGTTYTYGASNGTLTANWTPKSYTVTCEDRVGDSSGYLLGTSTESYDYGTTVNGSAFGSDTTPNAYYTGFKYSSSSSATVTGNITVYRYFSVNTYSLSITQSNPGILVNAQRSETNTYTGMPSGALYDGSTIYYGDRVKITWTLASGYTADVMTINGTDVSAQSPPTETITATENITVVMLVKVAALVKIWDGSTWNNYQLFIWDGASWKQYKPVIWDGSAWVDY